MNPAMVLSIFFLGSSFLVLLFWPEKGLFWKWQRGLVNTRRVLLEDALKHFYDQEYNDLPCTLNGLSGALGIDGDEAAELLARLQVLGLVKSTGEVFDLTPAGRKEALRMIRIHRLWERYLADETGHPQTEWHTRAEKLEHHTSVEQIEALAASIGNPPYDPHGDPIPTATGKLPPKQGTPLTDLEIDEVAKIVHLEDEPSTVYAQLVAEGLHPGLQVRLLERSPQRLTFIAAGEEITLAPVVAANVTVLKLPKDEQLQGPFETLSSLKMGESGEVISISRNCRGQQRRRILDLGVIPGTKVTMELDSASGDPAAYNIRGATIALRKNQADMIRIRRMKEAA